MNPRVFVIPRTYKSGKRVWVVRWKTPGGRWGYESWGGDRTAAKRHADQIRHELRLGVLEDVIHVRWAEFVRLHLASISGRNRGSAAATLKGFDRLCRPAGPHSVTYTQVERYKLDRLETVSAVTVNRELRELKAAFNEAVKRHQIKSNPAADLKFAPEDRHLPVVVSDADKRLLLHGAPNLEWRGFLYLLMTTACRVGEIVSLTWGRVNFEARVVHLTNTKAHRDRLAPLVGDATVLLAELLTGAPKKLGGGGVEPASAFVFPGIQHNYRRTYDRLRKKLGIDFRLKDLRSTAASDVVNSAVRAAAKQLGHTKPGVTRRHYVNVDVDALRRVAEAEARRLKGA